MLSLDAYRGAIMLLMASSGLGLGAVAAFHRHSAIWQFLGEQSDHAAWAGCHLWDLIQPAFMFMVGVALPWSVANRRARGQSFGAMFVHALGRSLVLVLLGVFFSSVGSSQTVWSFNNVLTQIGLGYPILFLLSFTRPRIQWLAAFAILFGYWLLFALHPIPPPNFDWRTVGIGPFWTHVSGFAAHWEKSANFAAWFDDFFLNLFPRERLFTFSPGGYQTLNFYPSVATMTFGLLAGGLLRSPRPLPQKVLRLVLFGLAGLIVGQAIACAGLCPIVKRIWSPAWAIYSGGWVTLFLAAFVVVVDWVGWKRWTFPLVVVGLNPITLYCLWQVTPGFIIDSFKIHLGQHVFEFFGEAYTRMIEHLAVLLVLWLIILWMWRKKIFIRI